jgi:hypothetical protein
MIGTGIRTFLQAASETESDCLREYPKFVEFVDKIDGLFKKVLTAEWQGDPLGTILLLNSHASFLAAVRIALSGQCPPTHMVLRGALESALYSLIASESDENRDIWLNRDKDKDRCRRLYTAKNALRRLQHDPNLLRVIDEAYDLLIDFGAHPNRRSILDHIRIEDREKHYAVSLTYLHNAPSTQAVRAIAACVETGLAIACIFPHALPNLPAAGEVHAEAIKIRQEYDSYIVSEFEYVGPPLNVGADDVQGPGSSRTI